MQVFSSATLLLRQEGGCPALNWPALLAAIKAFIIRYSHCEIDAPTRSAIKGWLKSDQCTVALLGFTFIHTLSLNAGVPLRQQLATAVWMERLEKLLVKPQHPLVQAATAQVLVDWIFLFKNDILGIRSSQVVTNHKHKQCLEGVTPSKAAIEASEELRLGIPAIVPRRGTDFLYLSSLGALQASSLNSPSSGFFARNSSMSSTGSMASAPLSLECSPNVLSSNSISAGTNFNRPRPSNLGRSSTFSSSQIAVCESDVGGMSGRYLQYEHKQQQQGCVWSQVLTNLTLTPVPMHVTSSMVPGLLTQMQTDIAELRRRTAAARCISNPIPTTAVQPPAMPSHIAACVDAGYIAAERCSKWRTRVKELTHTMGDPASLALLLHELDQANAALEGWQRYASGGELFQALGLPTSTASRWRSELRLQLQQHHQHYQQQQQEALARQQQGGYAGYQEALLVDVDDLGPAPSFAPPASISMTPTAYTAPANVSLASSASQAPWQMPHPPKATSSNSANPFLDPAPHPPSSSSLIDLLADPLPPAPNLQSYPSLPDTCTTPGALYPSTSFPSTHTQPSTLTQPALTQPPVHAHPSAPIQPPIYNPFAQQHNQVPGATSLIPSSSQNDPSGWALFSAQDEEPLQGAICTRSLPSAGPTGGSTTGGGVGSCNRASDSTGLSPLDPFASNTGGTLSMQQQRQQQKLQQQSQVAATAASAGYSQPVPCPEANSFARSCSMGAPARTPTHAAHVPQASSAGVGQISAGLTGGPGPDWAAECGRLLSVLQTPQTPGAQPQVQPGAAVQIKALFRRMQAYYESMVSTTKSHSLSVLKDMQHRNQALQQQLQQQQQQR